MRFLFYYLCFALVLSGCKTEVDNSANEAFEANSKTVLANLEGFQNENMDYSMYAKDFSMLETTFGAEQESISLDEMRTSDKQMWETFDFKMLTDPPVLLPGVNPDTKLPDGSVRHYSSWEVTLSATDSTAAKSGVINLYESFDFDEEGKILTQQVYGDFSGMMMYLMSSN
jgi:hypothetical protein